MELARGANAPVPTGPTTVQVSCGPGVGIDVAALLLTAEGRVRDDSDFVFFNNPAAEQGAVSHRNVGPGRDVVDIDLARLPGTVDKVVVTASVDAAAPGRTFADVTDLHAAVAAATGETLEFRPPPMTAGETATVLVELYRRGDQWKVRAVGQGYDSGLAGIATDFGVSLDDSEPEPAPPPAAAAPPLPPPPAAAAVPPPPPPPPAAAAPPPPMPAPMPAAPAAAAGVPSGGPSITGDLFGGGHAEQQTQPGMSLQNGKMLKIKLNGEAMCRQGAMVAYQGQVEFKAQGAGGIGRMVRQKVTGEGIPLMTATGQGEVFLADLASDIFLIDLEGGNDALTINGKNVLAFEPTLQWDIKRVQGVGMLSNSGLFNCVFTGAGRIAITCKGAPVVLTVDAPTYADPQAAVCWSASLQTGYHRADQMGLGTLLGRSTGEAFTMSFSGNGFVVVQPAEEMPGGMVGGTGGGQQAGAGGGLGGLLGR